MKEIELKAHAKINLTLDILGKRDDGYHEMKTVMQSLDFGDDVIVRLRDDGKIVSRSNLGFLPNDRRNIAVKAAELFFQKAQINGVGADIVLNKRIPVCAGMGGGSTDGAAVLRGLNELCGSPFAISQLEEMSREIGSDVAFCVAGGTQLGTGRGEVLQRLAPLPDCFIVVCKPGFSIQTPVLFREIDSCRVRIHPDTDGVLDALEKGSLRGVAMRLYNVFEDALQKRRGEIFTIKNSFLDMGALGTVMTGSGSAVFGIFESEDAAEYAHETLGKLYKDCYLTRPVGRYGDI